MTDEKIIEVQVTAEDLEKMKADCISEKDLPELGPKRYRPARHIVKDTDNDELRPIMERERIEESRENEKLAA